jgi:predicted Fe-Mo cluster-binding NifX family protein
MKHAGAGIKIAVTVWGHRVSPVFDSARTLLIAEIEGTTLVATSHLTFDPERPLELLQMLRTQQVALIICGAVSEGPAAMIEAAGVELIPFIAGDARVVLDHYLRGRPFGAEFRMPGCGRNICCRGKIRRGREIGPAPSTQGRGRAGKMTKNEAAATNEGGSSFPETAGTTTKQDRAQDVQVNKQA